MKDTYKASRGEASITGPNDILDDPQLAAMLHIEPRTLRLWRQTRALPFIRLTPKVIRYRRSDIDRWLAGRTVAISA